MALGVPDATAAGWLPAAFGAVTVTGVVVTAGRDRLKDINGMRFHAAKEESQASQLRSAVRRAWIGLVLSAAPCLVLLPIVGSVVNAAVEPPRAWSTVKAVLLFVYAVAVAVAALAAADVARATSARRAWRQERDAVL